MMHTSALSLTHRSNAQGTGGLRVACIGHGCLHDTLVYLALSVSFSYLNLALSLFTLSPSIISLCTLSSLSLFCVRAYFCFV